MTMAHIPNHRRLYSHRDAVEYELCTGAQESNGVVKLSELESGGFEPPTISLSQRSCNPDEEPLPNTTWQRFVKAVALQATYQCFKQYQRNSRYYGWRWGVLMGVITSTIVMTLNIALIVVASRKDRHLGVGTLFSGNERTVFRVNTGLHVLINVCSTLLLSASNYGMQLLCSPTRTECDRAHNEGRSLDVGMLSIFNLKHVTRRRRWLWIALASSSMPLHLFYNGSVYQVVALHEYAVSVIEFNSSEWSAQMENATLGLTKVLTAPELKTGYGYDKAAKWRDVTLSIDHVELMYYENMADPIQLVRYIGQPVQLIKINDKTKNVTSSLSKVYHTFPITLRNESGTAEWVESLDKDGWIGAGAIFVPVGEDYLTDTDVKTLDTAPVSSNSHITLTNPASTNSTTTTKPLEQAVNVFIHVQSAFARPKPDFSRISLNLPLLIIVAISNFVKVTALILILKGTFIEPPLVTVGDAICSFLERPDMGTVNYRNYSQEDYLQIRGTAKIRALPRIENTERGHELGHWEARIRKRFGSNMYRYKWMEGCLVYIILYGILTLVGAIVLVSKTKLGPWGTASQQRYNFSNALDGSKAAGLSILVNAPQLLLSSFYLAGNRLCTRWAATQEYNQFGIQPKPLRVSKPQGKQRGTYFLQLPFRWAIPLMIVSGTMHWLLSQALFLDRRDRLDPDGNWDRPHSIAACGVSGSASLMFFVFFFTSHIILVTIAASQYVERVPYTGSYSWAISAACHPPAEDVGVPSGDVAWGLVPKRSSTSAGAGGYSFSSHAIVVPTQVKVETPLFSWRRSIRSSQGELPAPSAEFFRMQQRLRQLKSDGK